MFIIRDGKLGFGCEPARVTGALINRVGSASLAYEPLMCDVINTSYDIDADEGGVFGNGITPYADTTLGLWTSLYLVAPMAIVQEAGVANGSPVRVIFSGPTACRVNSGSASARANLTYAQSQRYLTLTLGARTLAIRFVGFSISAHGGTGTETLSSFYFSGLSNTA